MTRSSLPDSRVFGFFHYNLAMVSSDIHGTQKCPICPRRVSLSEYRSLRRQSEWLYQQLPEEDRRPYVNLIIEGGPAFLTDRKVSKVKGLLEDQACTVFLGEVSLYAGSGRVSQGLYGTNGMVCELAGIQEPPCLLYFREQLKTRSAKIRDAVEAAQTIPDERLRYEPTDKLNPIQQEFFKKSGLDVVIVLGGG